MRLLAVEVRRLTARRLVRVLVALALVGLLVAAAKSAYESNRDFGAARAKAAARAADVARSFKAATAECEAAKRAGRAPAGTDCGAGAMAQAGQGFPSLDPQGFYVDPRFDFRKEMPGRVDAAAILLAVVGFVVGASAIGAEWSAGTLASLLFWAPQRLRVLGAKALAVVCVLAVATVGAEALVLAAGYATAASRGTLDHATSGLAVSLALRVLRGIGLVAFTSLTSFAVAGLVRNTGAALGAGFVYFAIVENFVRGVRPGWARCWSPATSQVSWSTASASTCAKGSPAGWCPGSTRATCSPSGGAR
ncbi:MAG: hypothetical protein NVSMB13_08560 [Mycobacteriales bacterium]